MRSHAMGLDDGAGDRKAQPNTSCIPASGCFEPHKRMKDPLEVFLVKSWSVVFDGNLGTGIGTLNRDAGPLPIYHSILDNVSQGSFERGLPSSQIV